MTPYIWRGRDIWRDRAGRAAGPTAAMLALCATFAAAHPRIVGASPAAMANPITPFVSVTPEPAQVPAKEGFVDVGGARLWYWDTGGPGQPVVLLHPGTGSAESWTYQQPVFAKSGLRVIAFSRRGAYRSEPSDTPKPAPASNAEDLHRFLQALGLSHIHLVGSAAGAFVAAEYVASHPERLRSVVIASSMIGFKNPEYQQILSRTLPPNFEHLPPEFRELGPSYRVANPAGTARWVDIQKRARAEAPGASGEGARRPPPSAAITYERLAAATRKVPTLLLTGDADLYMPPALLQFVATKLHEPESAIIENAGHAAFWEQPAEFNRIVLDFIARHSR